MDSKDKILSAALSLFIKEGFHGTSTSKIAEESGLSNGTLFHHFKTKESLINSLYLKTKEDYKTYLCEHIEQDKPTRVKIKQLWLSCAKWNLENTDGKTFFIMFSNSPYIDHLSKEEGSRHFSFIYEIIQQAIDEEILINTNPRLIFNYLLASVQAYANFINDSQNEAEEYSDVAFKMFWRSIANI